MNQDHTKRKLSAILSSDVVGYSRLMEADEAWTIQNLEENKKLISSIIEERNGRVVDATGDNILAEFNSVINAVECAVKIQKELNKKNSKLMEEHRMNFRMGVNLGDVVEEEGRLYGNGVNIAARLEGLAEPGGICISHTAYDQVKSKVDVDYDYLGEYQVKNINEPVKAYRILIEDYSPKTFVSDDKSQKRIISFSITNVVIFFLVVALGATIAALYPGSSELCEVTRFEYVLPREQPLRFGGAILSISPDGKQFVYCTKDGLCLRSMNEFHARFIPGTDANSQHPFFSPDGRWIGYWSVSEQLLKKIAISGGTPMPICGATNPLGPSWSIDDTIVYAQAEGILGVSSNGGTPKVIVASKGDRFFEPRIISDGKLALFTIIDENEYKIAVQSLETEERNIIVPGMNARYLETGHLVYSHESNLYAVPFDPETLEPASSGPFLMAEGLSSQRGADTSQYAISDSGTLVYIQGGSPLTEGRILARVDRGGHINWLNAPPKAYVSPRISPDGMKLVIQAIEDDSVSTLWMYDLTDDREIRQLTLEGSNCRPIWTPDSKRITFSSDHEGAMSIYWMPADGSSSVERLTTAEDGTRHLPNSWSPNDKTLAYTVERTYNTDCDICFISMGGEPECLYDHPNTVYMGAQFSPDGRWVAYFSGPEAGEADVYIERFPPTGLPNQITYGGGRGVWPMWSPDSDELFYRPSTSSGQPNVLKAVDITTEPEFSFQNERTLPIKGFSTVGYYRDYDITPDGTEFLMTFPAGSAESLQREKINIVVNWIEELKQRVPVN